MKKLKYLFLLICYKIPLGKCYFYPYKKEYSSFKNKTRIYTLKISRRSCIACFITRPNR